MRQFFPDPLFGWLFIATLVALTTIMAFIDSRTASIPKKLTLGTLIAGLIANTIRCALLAYHDKPTFFLDTSNLALAAVDGLLFALIGAVVAFAVMFVLWILNVCGGGDVKLVTGVGAWMGVFLIGPVILVSIGVLFAILMFRIFTGRVKLSEMKRMKRPGAAGGKSAKATGATKPSRLRTTYSLPICIATIVILVNSFGVELRLVEPRPPSAPVQRT